MSDSYSNTPSNNSKQERYPAYLKKQSDKNRFQKSLTRFRKGQSVQSDRKVSRPQGRVVIGSRFKVEEIREEDFIQEKQKRTIRPKLRLVMDNEFLKYRHCRARSLEVKEKNNLPSIVEEQENQPSLNFKVVTMLYDHSESSHVDRRRWNNLGQPQEGIREDDDSEEEQEDNFSSQSNNQSANSFRT